jgi:predicted ATPase/DNA-binding XRE family transcriptional regulator
MKLGPPGSFGAQLKALREAAGYTQEELATIAGLSVHAVSALERGERRRPHVETVRALSAALDLTGAVSDGFMRSARAPAVNTPIDQVSGVSLPLAPTALLGREVDVQTLEQWFADPAVRLVTLTGPGGVGKTRLALEVAHAIAADAANRVVFVPLAAIQAPTFVAPAIAEGLGLANVPALDLPKRARLACADQRTLLVLDNFEHVIDAAPLVAELLTSVVSLKLLITSRALLRVRGEREYVLGPLALEATAEEMAPADLALLPAVRLFVERVRDVQPDFRLTSTNGPTVTAICRRLDALPLALELAAPWLKALTAENLLRRLEHDALFSTIGRRDLPERQQTMNATVAWSYGLLDADEQRAFRRLGVLPGLFPIDAAGAVLAGREGVPVDNEALRTTASLIDKSLIVHTGGPVVARRPLYQMLETVRAYAAHALAAASERDDAMEGLVRYCGNEVSLAAQGLIGAAQAEWLDRVREDLESYRAALTWLIECDRPAEASGIASALTFFWLIRGHAPEGLRWYERILSLAELPPSAEVRSLIGAASMLYWLGDHSRARSEALRAIALAHETADLEMVAQAEHLLGHVEYALGNLDAARDRFMHAVSEFRALAIPWGTGLSLTGLAQVALVTGDADHAERLIDEATEVLRHEGPWFLTLGFYVRSILAVRRGDADRVMALVRDNLALLRDLQSKTLFYTLVPLAAAAVLKGEHALAARVLGVRDAITKSAGVNVVDPSMRDVHEAAEREARARLGSDRWAAAYAAGHKLSIDGLLRDIDGVLHRRSAGVSRNPFSTRAPRLRPDGS